METPLDQAAAPLPVVQLLRCCHSHTWYTLGSSDVLHQTEQGSRPGSPLADVAFNSLMALVLQELQQHLDQCGPLQTAFVRLGLRALPVAWVDDLAIPVVSTHSQNLAPLLFSPFCALPSLFIL